MLLIPLEVFLELPIPSFPKLHLLAQKCCLSTTQEEGLTQAMHMSSSQDSPWAIQQALPTPEQWLCPAMPEDCPCYVHDAVQGLTGMQVTPSCLPHHPALDFISQVPQTREAKLCWSPQCSTCEERQLGPQQLSWEVSLWGKIQNKTVPWPVWPQRV